MNKLLNNFEFIPYNEFSIDELDHAISFYLTELQKTLDIVIANNTSSWNEVATPLHNKIYQFNRVWGIVNHLMSVDDNETIRNLYNKHQPSVTSFFINLGQNKSLYEHYNKIKQNSYNELSVEHKKVLDNEFRDFYLSGIGLEPIKQQQFKEIQNNLEQLSTKFAQNVLDSTDSFVKYVTIDELTGIPEDILAQYKNEATLDGKTDLYKLTLHMPSYLPIMQYADNTQLREEMYKAYVTRASELTDTKFDNTSLMKQIVELRQKKAKLLGFNNYSELSLYTKMAKNYEEVLKFLYELADKSTPYALNDMKQLSKFAKDNYGVTQLNSWDIPFFSEKLQQAKYSYSNNDLKQYFQLPIVLDGLFKLIFNLYKIKFEINQNITSWHTDVTTFNVIDNNNDIIGHLYLDLYSRNGKLQGAWMNSAQDRYCYDNILFKPIAYIICNFAKPTDNLPSLLTFDDVQTLFHEMGHALHHLLTKINSHSIAGINGVEWDAVELPSQFMEYFTWNYDIISTISKHITTQDVMPKELFNKLLASRYYQAGLQMLRQLEFAIFDILLHCNDDNNNSLDFLKLLDEVRNQVAVIIPPKYNRFANSFTHIFAGGYASGYYSYKWAEVLATDIFSVFDNQEINQLFTLGNKFKDTILSKGGLYPMMDNFKKFMGRTPQVESLIKYSFGEIR